MNRTEINRYSGREQTFAKHFILRRYLQALAFKVLNYGDIAYVDGFSGPWKTETEDFSDSSFMIAIRTLLEVQQEVEKRIGVRRKVRCFFSEENSKTFESLARAVRDYHKPHDGFEIQTYLGRFEDAVDEVQQLIGSSFPLIFIDPTGWTGYPFAKIKPLFERQRCEVLITFMYDFVYRFTHSDDKATVESLNHIFGGPGWRTRLDPNLSRGDGIIKLFRDTLKTIGDFKCVVSTRIDRPTIDRPHFFIVYATKRLEGLKAFRQTEYDALRFHVRNRGSAQERKREKQTGMADLFAGHQASVRESDFDQTVQEQKELASAELMKILRSRKNVRFEDVLIELLESYMLRETNIKDICVQLAKDGKIVNTWGRGNRKPRSGCKIRFRDSSEFAGG